MAVRPVESNRHCADNCCVQGGVTYTTPGRPVPGVSPSQAHFTRLFGSLIGNMAGCNWKVLDQNLGSAIASMVPVAPPLALLAPLFTNGAGNHIALNYDAVSLPW